MAAKRKTAAGLDRVALEMAREWVNENHPTLTGIEYQRAVFRAYRDLKDPATRAPNRAGAKRAAKKPARRTNMTGGKMHSYRIVSAQGVDMGTYRASSEAKALDRMARAAGYRDQSHAASVAGAFKGRVIRVDNKAGGKRTNRAGTPKRSKSTGRFLRSK